jgi:hypothetical protein
LGSVYVCQLDAAPTLPAAVKSVISLDAQLFIARFFALFLFEKVCLLDLIHGVESLGIFSMSPV